MKYIIIVALMVLSGDTVKKPQDTRVYIAAVLIGDGEFITVLRTKEKKTRYLPISIGEIEAMNIKFRLDQTRFPRPLTLDLLQSVLDVSRIKVVSVHINGLSSGIFLGTLTLEKGGRRWKLDARPSDLMGLAAGSDIPIMVSNSVLNKAAFTKEDVEKPTEQEQSYEETL